jgi:hypothetical protein
MKIGFNNIICTLPVKHLLSRGQDSINLLFYIDDLLSHSWPSDFPFTHIDENMSVAVNMVFEFKQTLKVVLYNNHKENTGEDDKEFLGEYTFGTTDNGNGNVKLDSDQYDSKYNLEYKYYDDEVKIPYVRLLGIKCLKPAKSIDSAVVSAIFNTISSAVTKFAESVQNVPDPRAQAASAALSVAGAIFAGVPEIAIAIAESSSRNDEIYVTLGSVTSKEMKIFPERAEYQSMYIDSVIDLYVFDKTIEYPVIGTTQFSIWEKDDHDERDPSDYLGQVNVYPTESIGYYMQTAWSPSQGSLYLVSYEIIEK